MSLSRGSEQFTTDQLLQAIRRMGDFLLKDSKDSFDEFDELKYKKLYEEINRLTVKAKLEGYFDYEHKNKYKTLKKFSSNRNFEKLVIKYYSIPFVWNKVLKKQSTSQKILREIKRFIKFVADIANKIKFLIIMR